MAGFLLQLNSSTTTDNKCTNKNTKRASSLLDTLQISCMYRVAEIYFGNTIITLYIVSNFDKQKNYKPKPFNPNMIGLKGLLSFSYLCHTEVITSM